MKILVVGGGGREHAIVWKLAQSPRVDKIYCAPGNAGISKLAECVDISQRDINGLLRFAKEKSVDLTVVGPEEPLTLGIVDAFEEAGLRVFGPRKNAAEIEGSKVFSKGLMQKYGIPTARHETFDNFEAAERYLCGSAYPVVIKADGLAAGKGVVIAETRTQAEAALRDMMLEKSFGSSGDKVIFEEFLRGYEVSVLAFCDGETVRPMVSAKDHKRVLDGDMGPNTGGMGAVSPAPGFDEALERRCIKEIFAPTLKAMKAEGRLFKGVLYFGLMICDGEPKVIEYNARFGDPEAQAVLPRLQTDLIDIILTCIDGSLDQLDIRWDERAAICVVLASGGYPGKYQTGCEITGMEQAEALVLHAGTAVKDGRIVTAGGRVLGITALGDTQEEARRAAYKDAGRIEFNGKQYRSDIGKE